MSNRDINGNSALPDPSMDDSDFGFSDIFDSIDLSEFEFEDGDPLYEEMADPDGIPDLFSLEAQDPYSDSGAYRSYDGASEYRSFDAAMPEAPEEGWYHFSDEDGLPEEDFGEDGEEYQEEGHKHRGLKIFGNILLVFVTLISAFYLMVLYSGIPYLTNLRDMYVRTAMSTINHKWLATAIVPGNIIDELMMEQYLEDDATVGVTTDPDWGSVDILELPNFAQVVDSSDQEASPWQGAGGDTEVEAQYASQEEQTFFELFHELDYDSAQAYFKKHPETLSYGYAYVNINEAGLDDEGTEIYTRQGDQVLAINAYEGVLIVRIEIDSSRGVLAICKDTTRLSLCAATTLPATGQTAGKICENNNGILAMTGSAFLDPNGTGNGGQLSGLAICSGVSMGTRLGSAGDKRLELRSDNKMYIVDSAASVDSSTRDACEFRPALIVNGENVARLTSWGTSPNPRAVLGQSNRLETMMVVVEGRLVGSLGCTVGGIADKLEEYGCVQAMNLDGGTSAIMYYEGEYITRCSNEDIPYGRTLPSAWVYHKYA